MILVCVDLLLIDKGFIALINSQWYPFIYYSWIEKYEQSLLKYSIINDLLFILVWIVIFPIECNVT